MKIKIVVGCVTPFQFHRISLLVRLSCSTHDYYYDYCDSLKLWVR